MPCISLCFTRIGPALFPSILLLLVFSPCNQAQTAPSGPEGVRLADARSLLNKGLVSDAERVARAFLQEHQDSAEAHFFLGYILFKEIQSDAERNASTLRDDYQQSSRPPASSAFQDAVAKASLAEFTEGAKYHSPSAFDLKIVALDYVLLGDYADADKWLTRSLAWNPQDSEGWYYLGRTKYNENRFAEAVSAFEQCLKLDPKNVKAEDNLGLSFAGLGLNEEAATAYQTAIAWQAQLLVKNPGPYIDLGSLLLDENKTDEAISNLFQAVEISPRDSKAHETLGKAYARLDQLPKAQRELEKALELSPQSTNLHCMLAPVYRKQGLTEKAKLEFDRCAAMHVTHSSPEPPRP